MAIPVVQIQVAGLDAARAFYKRVGQIAGADPDELLHVAGGILEASTLRHFDEGRGPGDIPWPRSKRAIRDNGKTLVDKGGLEGSIRYVVTPGRLEVGVDARTVSATFGYVHQFGFLGRVTVPAHIRIVNQAFGVPLSGPTEQHVRAHQRVMNIPRREFLGVDDVDRRDIKVEWVAMLRRLLNA